MLRRTLLKLKEAANMILGLPPSRFSWASRVHRTMRASGSSLTLTTWS